MSSPIKVGDMVQLVWACCANGRRNIGWTGLVEDMIDCTLGGSFCYCGVPSYGMHAYVTIGGRGVVPVSWLIKIDPKAVGKERERELETT